MSQVYTLNGDIEPLCDDVEQCQPIFRKMVDFDAKYEITLANLVKREQEINKCQNIVKIFETKDSYIDMELLDINFFDENDENCINKKNDIKEALKQLNEIGIAYIDLREDNIGYSHTHKKWKLFDFDSSGLVDLKTKKWIIEPNNGFFFKQINKQYPNVEWYEYDQIRLKDMFKD